MSLSFLELVIEVRFFFLSGRVECIDVYVKRCVLGKNIHLCTVCSFVILCTQLNAFIP